MQSHYVFLSRFFSISLSPPPSHSPSIYFRFYLSFSNSVFLHLISLSLSLSLSVCLLSLSLSLSVFSLSLSVFVFVALTPCKEGYFGYDSQVLQICELCKSNGNAKIHSSMSTVSNCFSHDLLRHVIHFISLLISHSFLITFLFCIP